MSDDHDDFKVISENNLSSIIRAIKDLQSKSDSLNWKLLLEKTKTKSKEAALISTAAALTSNVPNALFRKSSSADDVLCSLWINDVMQKAAHTALLNPNITFQGLTLEQLRHIAIRSVDPFSIAEMEQHLLSAYGVILVCQKSFPNMKMDGVVTVLSNGLPVIGLSLRYSRYDNYWFTLMHELAHVSLHFDHLADVIRDDLINGPEDCPVEQEANRAAVDAFIPRRLFTKAAVLRSRSEEDLTKLANEANIHPIVAAGLIHHHLGNFKLFPRLVGSIDVREILGAAS